VHGAKSGGRQPPVGNIRRCESEKHIAGDVSRMQPGAGGVSPPWHAGVLVRARMLGNATPFRSHGSLTVAILVGKSCGPLARHFRATAGSRPPLSIACSTASEHCSIFIRNRSPHTPRRADARRSWLRVLPSASIVRFWSATVRGTHHGGLTPAALGCVFASPRTLLDSRWPAFAFPNHGGLTPAALGSVRLYIANVVFHCERTSCNQERLA
jgi:hypothetical protein